MRAAREIAALTIERLAQDYVRFFEIQPYLWESEPLIASKHFQDSLDLPSSFDVVVIILWSRLGTPLPERTGVREYRGIDGRAPVTGTEWEFEEALAGSQRAGRPQLLVYRCLKAAAFDLSNSAHRERQLEQLRALDRFWERHFGSETALGHTTYMTDAEFGTSVERTLRKLIEKEVADASPDTGAGSLPQVLNRPPFRGLESYEFEDAALYFGQDESISKGMMQLTAGDGRPPFLIILGASGSGKSSLAKAGIVPRLFLQRRVPGAAFVRRVLLRPSDAQESEDMFDALARRLTSTGQPGEGLPEILGPGQTWQDLAAHFRSATANAAFPIGTALGSLTRQLQSEGKVQDYESAKLLLIVDQLEELFTTERFGTEQRLKFIDLIHGLLVSGLVFVISTMRKDFWHRADETPQLVALAEGPGRLELLPPSLAQYSQIIRRPAEIVGVGFERNPDTGVPLNELIAAEVARAPRALPLLSYLLDQLYQADVLQAGGSSFTFASYQSLGGLEGAIANRAQTTLARCAPDAAAALSSVLFSLIQIGRTDGDADRAVSRRVPLSEFAAGTARRQLVDAFLHSDARLLATDVEGGSDPTVRVAHEALITRWDVARDFVQSFAASLQARQRIEERFARWMEVSRQPAPSNQAGLGVLTRWTHRRGGEGLLTDLDAADGQRLLRDHRTETAPELVAYIERSLAHGQRQRTRTVRLLSTVVIMVTALALIAVTASLDASKRRREAEQQSAQVLRAQQRLLTEIAATRLAEGHTASAQQIILEVLSRSAAPYPPEVVDVFERIRAADSMLDVLAGHTDSLETAEFSPDGRRLLTASRDKSIREWDARTGRALRQQRVHDDLVLTAVYSPDGRQILTASADGTARLWDAGNLTPLRTFSGHTGWVRSAFFTRDGRRIVTASYDHTAMVWDAMTGAVRARLLGHGDIVEWAEFSPDGTQVVTASLDKTARIWDAASGRLLRTLSGHLERVATATYAPDGERILTTSFDRTARIWDARTGALLRVLSGHSERLESGRFSPDGQWILTAAADNTARLWDAHSGTALNVLTGHTQLVISASFSPDGTRIATASYDFTARLWDATAILPERAYPGHSGAISMAAYSPDGSRLVTAARDNTARIWNAGTGEELTRLTGHTDIVNSAVFSPDGRQIATSAFDKTVRLWDAQSGHPLATLTGHQDVVQTAVFSPDGRTLASSSLDKTLRLWDLASGTSTRTLTANDEQPTGVVYSPDGALLAATYRSHLVRLWNAARGEIEKTLSHDAEVSSALFSLDGASVITASDDQMVRIWSTQSGRPLQNLSGFGHPVYQADFAPDGRSVLGLSDDGVLRFYDLAAGVPIAVLHPAFETSCFAFARDGLHVLTGSSLGDVHLWRVPPRPPLAFQIDAARAGALADLSPAEREQLGIPTPPATSPRGGGTSEDPQALARRADAEDAQASSTDVPAERAAHLRAAFDLWTRAEQANSHPAPDLIRQSWRNRRANIARELALEEGDTPELARLFARVGH